MSDLKRDDRVILQIRGVVRQDDWKRGEDLMISQGEGYHLRHVTVSTVISVLPPVQNPGAAVTLRDGPEGNEFAVVMHDASSGCYVLRNVNTGLLRIDRDDEGIVPLERSAPSVMVMRRYQDLPEKPLVPRPE